MAINLRTGVFFLTGGNGYVYGFVAVLEHKSFNLHRCLFIVKSFIFNTIPAINYMRC